MTSVNLALSAEEHALLLRLLAAAWSELRVEVHHARFSPGFPQGLEQDEILVAELLEKVKLAAL